MWEGKPRALYSRRSLYMAGNIADMSHLTFFALNNDYATVLLTQSTVDFSLLIISKNWLVLKGLLHRLNPVVPSAVSTSLILL